MWRDVVPNMCSLFQDWPKVLQTAVNVCNGFPVYTIFYSSFPQTRNSSSYNLGELCQLDYCKEQLCTLVEITDLERLHLLLGIEITRNSDSHTLSLLQHS